MTVLQVRQGMIQDRSNDPDHLGEDLSVRWGGWIDVQSPGWLQAYVLPYQRTVYEFRQVDLIEGQKA